MNTAEPFSQTGGDPVVRSFKKARCQKAERTRGGKETQDEILCTLRSQMKEGVEVLQAQVQWSPEVHGENHTGAAVSHGGQCTRTS